MLKSDRTVARAVNVKPIDMTHILDSAKEIPK
jgi:hypothetical protein